VVNQKIVDWISEQKIKGYSEKELRGFLSKKYDKKEIDEAFNFISNKKQTFSKKTNQNNFEFWDKINYLFTKPSLFFERIKSEPGIGGAFIAYIITLITAITLFYFMTFTLSSYFFGNYSYGYLGFLLPIYLLIGLGFVIGFGFAYSGIVHGIIRIFNGKGSFADTYKIYAYSSIPSTIISTIPFIGWLSIIYTIYLAIIGTESLHNITKGKAAIAWIMPGVLIIGTLLFFIIIYFIGFGLRF